MISGATRGIALRAVSEGPTYPFPSHGETTVVDNALVLNGNILEVFLTNRSVDDSAEVEVRPAHIKIQEVKTARVLTGSDPKAENSFEKPHQIEPQEITEIQVREGVATVEIPPLSFTRGSFQMA
jgi:alpha-N-arabinofuranosidase